MVKKKRKSNISTRNLHIEFHDPTQQLNLNKLMKKIESPRIKSQKGLSCEYWPASKKPLSSVKVWKRDDYIHIHLSFGKKLEVHQDTKIFNWCDADSQFTLDANISHISDSTQRLQLLKEYTEAEIKFEVTPTHNKKVIEWV